MLSKDQAQLIGTELLKQERSEKLEALNEQARPVPILYRNIDFDKFEKWERPLLVREARKAAFKNPIWLFSRLICVALLVLYGILRGGAANQSGVPLLPWLPILVVITSATMATTDYLLAKQFVYKKSKERESSNQTDRFDSKDF